MKSAWPHPGAERRLRSMAPTASDAAEDVKPPRGVSDSLRHDARSAAHTMQGFLELFGSGVLGALSPIQEQSLRHLAQAAERMHELVETAIDLGRLEQTEEDEPTPVLLSSLIHGLVHTLQREEPQLSLSYGPDLVAEQRSLVRCVAFETALRTLLMVAREQCDARLEITLSQSDLHTTLTILACTGEAPLSESVSQSLPAHAALTSELGELEGEVRNRDYLRLRRCEALLERQRGRLMVAPDLSRLRLMLPIQR
ncbi:MAG TPA: hypothetical protein VFZ61_19975 [Polyangiales bacterium]